MFQKFAPLNLHSLRRHWGCIDRRPFEGRHLVLSIHFLFLTFSNPDGGHFAAMEIPAELAKDIHNFVNTVERNRASQG